MSQSTPSVWKHPLVWLTVVAALLWAAGAMMVSLSPILSPFVLAVMLAYVCNPLVEALGRRRVNRSLGAVVAIACLVAAVTVLVMVLIPLVQDELSKLTERLPALLAWVTDRARPWLIEHGVAAPTVDAASIKKFLANHRDSAQSVLGYVLTSLGSSGAAVLSLAGTLLIAPVVMFYLLRDWPQLCQRVTGLIPRPFEARVVAIMQNIDSVLAEFLRGQLAVMISLAVFYSVALWIVGMDYALPVGLITGLLVFVPYVGFGAGLVLAMLVSIQQGWPTWGLVLGVFGLGQVLESFVLTPRLVGERIGLHPVAGIFALMAFGQVFGFIGVLLALPAAAVLLVGLREVRAVYLRSDFYRGSDNA